LFLPSVFATIFGAIITKEIPSISTLIGGTIIIIGSFIFNHIKMKLAAEKLQEENNKK
jgi:drug/metabolite transporter (DMT)-like permease